MWTCADRWKFTYFSSIKLKTFFSVEAIYIYLKGKSHSEKLTLKIKGMSNLLIGKIRYKVPHTTGYVAHK